MKKMLNNILYSFYTSRVLRSLISLAVVLLLSGCDKDDEINTNRDANYLGQSACWQSKITQSVLSIVDRLYDQGSSEILDGGANLIFVAFAVWMGFKLLKVLSSFKEESLGEVWTEIFQKLFVCAACAFLIMPRSGVVNPIDDAINDVILPIYQTLIELGLRALSADGSGGTTLASITLGNFGSISFVDSDRMCTDLFSFFTGQNVLTMKVHNGGLGAPLIKVTDCIVCEISDRLNAGYKMGITLVTSLSFGAMLVGFLILFLFTAAKFGFVLYVVDSMFRLNFAVFLLPVLIMGIPFSYTRKWSKHGFEMFINSSGIMFFMALLVNICASSLEKILTGLAISTTSIEAKDTALFTMFLISLLMLNIPGFAVVLANKYIGGGNGQEFNEKITKFLIKVLKAGGGAILNTASTGAATAVTTTIKKYDESRQALDHINQAKHSAKSVLNTLAGYSDDE